MHDSRCFGLGRRLVKLPVMLSWPSYHKKIRQHQETYTCDVQAKNFMWAITKTVAETNTDNEAKYDRW